MTYYLDYSATAANNTATPPKGAPEGMKPSEVNDTMRDIMSVIRQLGDASLACRAIWGGTSTGTASAYAIQTAANIGSYTDGRWFTFRAHTNHTGDPTLKINGLAAKPIRRLNNGVLLSGDIVGGANYIVIDNGSIFALLNPSGGQGIAAARNIGTASGNVPEVVDGSGNLNSALNVANKTLSNLTGGGQQRTAWASVYFNGSGTVFNSFNGCNATRNSAGLYTISFPNIGGTAYHVSAMMELTPDSSGTNCNVVAGTRTATSIQITCRKGNTSVDPFDPDIVSVVITKIG